MSHFAFEEVAHGKLIRISKRRFVRIIRVISITGSGEIAIQRVINGKNTGPIVSFRISCLGETRLGDKYSVTGESITLELMQTSMTLNSSSHCYENNNLRELLGKFRQASTR
ncbi:hypothetical protein KKA15_03465 [Patescibacteria group bacterium]|nr:hypothetical protein [Patescibacteria group bacterium]